MKTFFVVAFFAAFVAVQGLTEEQKETLRNHGKVCIDETGVDREVVKQARGGDFSSEDPKLKTFSFCMLKRSGLMTDDGVFHRDVAISKVEPEIRDKVGAAIDACLDKKGATNDETAFNYVKCYHTERPDHAMF